MRQTAYGMRISDWSSNLCSSDLFLQADRFFDPDLVERVHRHLLIGEIDAGAVGLDPRLHIIIEHPLDGDEDFHGLTAPLSKLRSEEPRVGKECVSPCRSRWPPST